MKWILLFVLFGCATKYVPVETDVPEEGPIASFPQEKRVVFTADSSLDYISEVAKVANCIINNEEFLKEVESYPGYTFTALSSKQVGESFRNFKPVIISTYKTKNPFSSAIATTYASDPKTVYFNTRKNPRDMKSMINTAIHEGGHLNGHGHGDNYPDGKEDSVNYKTGELAEKYVEKCK